MAGGQVTSGRGQGSRGPGPGPSSLVQASSFPSGTSRPRTLAPARTLFLFTRPLSPVGAHGGRGRTSLTPQALQGTLARGCPLRPHPWVPGDADRQAWEGTGARAATRDRTAVQWDDPGWRSGHKPPPSPGSSKPFPVAGIIPDARPSGSAPPEGQPGLTGPPLFRDRSSQLSRPSCQLSHRTGVSSGVFLHPHPYEPGGVAGPGGSQPGPRQRPPSLRFPGRSPPAPPSEGRPAGRSVQARDGGAWEPLGTSAPRETPRLRRCQLPLRAPHPRPAPPPGRVGRSPQSSPSRSKRAAGAGKASVRREGGGRAGKGAAPEVRQSPRGRGTRPGVR
ncbi:translation initiation factor IF-2-like [Cervus elaphus]|uniref:translation initiation factor IF-2-like n=1 Tax=Cervus elaphus TaxID=9860 RepID=UPI001CC31567|nr:translation initiation factor IF-2-like [Cervus elaphus]